MSTFDKLEIEQARAAFHASNAFIAQQHPNKVPPQHVTDAVNIICDMALASIARPEEAKRSWNAALEAASRIVCRDCQGCGYDAIIALKHPQEQPAQPEPPCTEAEYRSHFPCFGCEKCEYWAFRVPQTRDGNAG